MMRADASCDRGLMSHRKGKGALAARSSRQDASQMVTEHDTDLLMSFPVHLASGLVLCIV